MTNDEAAKCKLRFKGVENFLRKVAFNLGNTPSQTEVKIISCIPIDVTDLQQKIINLERQLENSRNTTKHVEKRNVREMPTNNIQKSENENECTSPASTVQTAMCTNTTPKFVKPSPQIIEATESKINEIYDGSFSNHRNSDLSFIHSDISSIKVINTTPSKQSDFVNNSCTVTKKNHRNIFKKHKRVPNKKNKSPLIYYTETSGTPFRNNITHAVKEKDSESRLLIQSYSSNMMKKQYHSRQVLDKFSNTSHFTSPICRDIEHNLKNYYEADMCSCCHGPFQNIDNYLPKNNFNMNTALSDKLSTYYDSSLYDLIPVKEKPVRNRKGIDTHKRKETRVDINCCPGDVRVKPRYQRFLMDYHSPMLKKNSKRDSRKRFARINNKRNDNNLKYLIKLDQQTGMESSKSCLVDFGDPYAKTIPKFKTNILSEKVLLVKNVECSTNDVNQADCQTATVCHSSGADENKTEVTLNQIKCILQSVLTEVKTNSQLKHIDEKFKKDAIIQKEDQNDMLDRSSLLNSFTYSPYNLNPYNTTCSKQMPSNCLCYPGILPPIQCMQNYPVIVQPQGIKRNLCTGCVQSSHFKPYVRNATTAGTNTDRIREHRNNETEKLIQEIYKSVALGIPINETSISECGDLKSAKTDSRNDKEVRLAISELFKNTNIQMDTSRTHDTNTTINNKTPKVDSARSRIISTETSTDYHERNKKCFLTDKNVQQSTETEPESEKEINTQTKSKRKTILPSTISESSESEDTSDTESDDTVVSVKQVKKKGGLLSKICRFFNKNKNKVNAKDESVIEETDTSDSDDYQTVYSHKSEVPKEIRPVVRRSRAHSKILNSRRVHQYQRSPERQRQVPNMEQEYRRYWNEKLMFDNEKRRYSSEKPFSRETDPRTRYLHPYYRNYEARSVLVDPSRLCRPRLNHNGRSMYIDDPTGVKMDVIGKTTNYVPGRVNNINLRAQEIVKPNNPINKNDCQNIVPTFYDGHRVTNETKLRNRQVNAAKPKNGSWLKKHKIDVRCGDRWRQLILES